MMMRATWWLFVCALFALASAALWLINAPEQVFAYDAESWRQRLWTLWSSALMHINGWHLFTNLVVIGALAAVGYTVDMPAPPALAWLASWPLVTLGLTLWPSVSSYVGLSGVTHAGVAVLSVWLMLHGRLAWWTLLIPVGLAVKLVGEHAWTQPIAFRPYWQFNVVFAAHLSGAVVGSILTLGAYFFHQGARRVTGDEGDA